MPIPAFGKARPCRVPDRRRSVVPHHFRAGKPFPARVSCGVASPGPVPAAISMQESHARQWHHPGPAGRPGRCGPLTPHAGPAAEFCEAYVRVPTLPLSGLGILVKRLSHSGRPASPLRPSPRRPGQGPHRVCAVASLGREQAATGKISQAIQHGSPPAGNGDCPGAPIRSDDKMKL